MPRNIAFDKTYVLDQACRVFWQLGYTKTTMRNLSQATGLNPGSIYNHFGNKHSLFLEVTNYYYSQLTDTVNLHLTNDIQADELLMNFFLSLLGNDSANQHRGCLLVNTFMECANEAEIQAHIAAMFTGFEEMFYWIIVKGQKQGVIRPGLKARTEAKALVNTYYGIRVQTLTDAPLDELRELITYKLERLT